MTEEALYEQVAHYLRLKHPGLLFHFDLSGMWTPSHKARNLYGRLNKRAWPDLFVVAPNNLTVVYAGLFIELKREGTKLKKKDGAWTTPHIAEQAEVLDQLMLAGYLADFAVGFEEAVVLIGEYRA